MTMRYAICNETFGDWGFPRVCAVAADYGYTGIEIAPFTLAPRITDVSESRRRELRQQAESAGLTIVGLHWLLAKTEGFQVTSSDAEIRRRTAAYLGELARCCRDLGGSIMVFGSPLQRRIPAGHSLAQATDFAFDTFRQTEPALAETGVTLALEPLAPAECDFLTTCSETCRLLDRLNHPNIKLHLDVKAMTSEATPIPELIKQNAGRIAHFHANDANRRGPGFGDVDFRPILRALHDVNYPDWVSVGSLRLFARPDNDCPRLHPVSARMRTVNSGSHPAMTRRWRILLSLGMLWLFCVSAIQSASLPVSDAFNVGFGEADITPMLQPGPVYMAGFGHNRKATGVLDPIKVRAVVIQSGRQKIAFACADVVGLFLPCVEHVRKELPGFDYVVVSSTHNHHGPDTMGLWGENPFKSRASTPSICSMSSGKS